MPAVGVMLILVLGQGFAEGIEKSFVEPASGLFTNFPIVFFVVRIILGAGVVGDINRLVLG